MAAVFVFAAGVCGALLARAAEGPADAWSASSVARVVTAHCIRCHNWADRKGGLDLSTRDGFVRGGDSGPALVEGDPDGGLLLRRVREGSMPPIGDGEMLSEAEINVIGSWVAAGAPWPAGLVLTARCAPPEAAAVDSGRTLRRRLWGRLAANGCRQRVRGGRSPRRGRGPADPRRHRKKGL
jgi:mono/diheme cytochrome c family protein